MNLISKRCYFLSNDVLDEMGDMTNRLFNAQLKVGNINIQRVNELHELDDLVAVSNTSCEHRVDIVLVALNTKDKAFSEAINSGLSNVRVVFMDNKPFHVVQNLINPDSDVLTAWLNVIHNPVIVSDPLTFPDEPYRISYQTAFAKWINKNVDDGEILFVPSRSFGPDEFDCELVNDNFTLTLKAVPLAKLICTDHGIEPRGGFLTVPELDFDWRDLITSRSHEEGRRGGEIIFFPKKNIESNAITGMAATGNNSSYQRPPDLVSEDGTFEVRFGSDDLEAGTSVVLTSTDTALKDRLLIVRLLSANGEVVAEHRQILMEQVSEGSVLERKLWFEEVEPEDPGLEIDFES